MPWHTGIDRRQCVAPVITNLMEIGVADPTEQNFNLHVVFGGIPTRDGCRSKPRCRTCSGIGFCLVHEFDFPYNLGQYHFLEENELSFVREMSGFISEHHPLTKLFADLVQSRLLGSAGLDDMPTARYIAGVLVDFSHVENLYKIRGSKGKRLEDVGDMLIASNPILDGRSF